MDTIFALATPPGKSGVAIIRTSGDRSSTLVERLTGRGLPPARRLSLRRLADGDELIDEALVAWFPAGGSFTGEDMAEFQVHGGRAIIQRLLSVMAECENCRHAEPGEFTRRALEAGNLDLTQVEGLADLIDADTDMQRRQALAVMNGALSEQAHAWRAMLVSALALLEASLDFADEEDAPVDVSREVADLIARVASELRAHLAGAGAAEKIREGFRVALVGAPNSGKSTLFNRIVGRDAALTSPVAGTTRDVLEASCDLDGIPVVFQDVAGLRNTGDEVEALGVDRAVEVIEAADMRLFLHCRDVEPDSMIARRPGDVVVWSKADLGGGDGDVVLSAKTDQNVDVLLSKISAVLAGRVKGSELVARLRQRTEMEKALRWLDSVRNEDADEIRADTIRRAVGALRALIGEIGVEDVFDEIFSRFCMGK